MTTKKNLCKIKGMSEAKVDKLKEVASKLLDCGFITATELSIKRQCVFKISSGSLELDKLLGGISNLIKNRWDSINVHY